jgi:hypothetical protein
MRVGLVGPLEQIRQNDCAKRGKDNPETQHRNAVLGAPAGMN